MKSKNPQEKKTKLIAIGDTHGRDLWKAIVDKETDATHIVFIGDYFDTHGDISYEQQIENFKEILKFKKDNWDKVVLLIGNHDFHYLPEAGEQYSGYSEKYANRIGAILSTAVGENFLQACLQAGLYLFSHAGVTKTWCASQGIPTDGDLTEEINMLFLNKPSAFRFTPGANYDRTGDSITQSPLWVRPASLEADKLDACMQVVGHTTHRKLITFNDIAFIDCLETSGEYLIIEGGDWYPSKV